MTIWIIIAVVWGGAALIGWWPYITGRHPWPWRWTRAIDRRDINRPGGLHRAIDRRVRRRR
jgi:hypothetical protein